MRLFLLAFIFISSVVSAQVTDNFSDGDFTAAPAWSGDGTEFVVNATQQLQLNNTVAGASYLSTASPTSSLNNIEWHFYIKQSFAPSGSNYGRVYLASDQANLEASLNGYYLQFGEAGSLDAVELFRQTGTTSTSVCRGTSAQIAASFAIGIRVTRNATGAWSLYVDPAGGTAYALEATGTDATYTTTSFFGVAAVYTLSNATKFYFDDFYNGALVVDTTPPVIVSSTVISSTQLDVLFNETVDLTTSQTLSNYSANNSLGNPSAAVRDAGNLSLVHLTFAIAFTDGLLNTLTVTNVQDASANAITTATSNFTYFAPVTAAYKNIIINEIFADPTPQVTLPLFEFTEIYNRGTSAFDLNGWKFSDGSSTATLSSYNLLPGHYLILCPSADTASFSPYGPVMGLGSFPSLNNTGDHVYLIDNLLTLIDSVNYSDAWYQDVVKKDGGWTLELINPNAPIGCPASNNWIASINAAGGTPGTQNSVYSTALDVTAPTILGVSVTDATHITLCYSEAVDVAQIGNVSNYNIDNSIGTPLSASPNSTFTCVDLTLGTALTSTSVYTLTVSNMADCSGNALTPATATFNYYVVRPFDVVINEIMADPDPVVATLPDYEYVELYNKTASTINLGGWQYTAGTTTKVLPSIVLPAHGFVTLTSTTAAPLFAASANAVGIVSFPGLTNTGEALILRNPQGTVISNVSYTDSWYRDAAKKDGGYSLEQIDPANPCAGSSNWRASNNVTGGTPGLQNSIYASNADHSAPRVSRVSIITADTIQVYFNEPLDSASMLSPAIYSIDNSIGTPTQVVPVGPDFMSVRLALANPLQTAIIYTITVNNAITDCVGNPIGTANTARFAIPVPAAANDIVINEILADPNTGGVDFVEIYNRSSKVIDLRTIQLSEYDTVVGVPINPNTISASSYLIFPGDYLVLSENGNAVKSQYNTLNPEAFLDLDNIPTMNISAGTLCLNVGFTVIDHFTYYEDMQFPLLNVTKGVTLERVDFNRPTQDRSNWHSASQAVGFGTPGYKNSQYNDAGTTDNAIEITPEIFSPDEDGYNDIVNIKYHFDTPNFIANVTIYDSEGREVKLLVRNQLLGINGVFSWDGINDDHEKSRIGIYIIYFEVFDLAGNVKHYKKTCVLGGKL
ncbi:MAG: hypothetical protein JWP12_2080 [Bacteroidetes bacterium]|nr:hypothetical protein [Bacteroidota bacterium]